ncbi:uncharacterized protein MCYG_03000 [Microsporum canis CBS 113480]|uniref:Uncharacterized protein n=1 Tax=Arthroderma otae (strain ATCC MYA-4605 / CBS 113480) TaxID=554155 RepID=C5FKF9_ARTOC|nr:uncharacterized protein MCYG_03000 [Microsporum canis CBS 113480]EEQ30181.1 predicted protein [Microsporum canis CBS 113480]
MSKKRRFFGLWWKKYSLPCLGYTYIFLLSGTLPFGPALANLRSFVISWWSRDEKTRAADRGPSPPPLVMEPPGEEVNSDVIYYSVPQKEKEGKGKKKRKKKERNGIEW